MEIFVCYGLITGSNLSADIDIVAVGYQWYFNCVKSWLLQSDLCQLHSKNIYRIVTLSDWPRSPLDNSCILSS